MANEDFDIDVTTRHAVFVERYSGGLSKRYISRLDKTLKRIKGLLNEENIERIDKARLQILTLDIEQLMAGELNAAAVQTMEELNRFVLQEASFAYELLDVNIKPAFEVVLPTNNQIQTALAQRSFSPNGGKTSTGISEALSTFGASKVRQVKQAITDGILLGETAPQVTERISEISKLSKGQARTLTRTMTNQASGHAQQEVFMRNQHLMKGYRWISTLDTRTSLICAGRDGKEYSFDESNPKPLAHWNCRSKIVGIIKDEYAVKKRGEAERFSRGDDGGEYISAKTNYGQWLKKQPAAFQKEYFSQFPNGEEKYKLFKKGGLKLDRFTSNAGSSYTLDELRSLNPIEFAKADI